MGQKKSLNKHSNKMNRYAAQLGYSPYTGYRKKKKSPSTFVATCVDELNKKVNYRIPKEYNDDK